MSFYDNITGPDPMECNTDEHFATFELTMTVSAVQRTSRAHCDEDMEAFKAKVEKALEELGFIAEINDDNIWEK
jgi:hypothetical protein